MEVQGINTIKFERSDYFFRDVDSFFISNIIKRSQFGKRFQIKTIKEDVLSWLNCHISLYLHEIKYKFIILYYNKKIYIK